ncbi:Gti1/Pac2 family-domain-containing protein [Xylariaceae sp. FL0594]|nr:Gti1/Pac2 family-domain-containing protein [Xylariaceae sp. FL0594]
METYHGIVRNPADAIKLFEACRLGQLPRVQRRLSEKERQSIRSGSVFVWDEREAGMRRWTDGKSWSASRVSGSFLTYREMEGKRSTGFGGRRTTRSPEDSRPDEEQDDGEPEGYRYKTDGLMKQSFSITTLNGQHLHLISYLARPQPGDPALPQPTTDPQLRHIAPSKSLYPDSNVQEATNPPLTRAPMPTYPNTGVYPRHDPGAYPNWAGRVDPAWMSPFPGHHSGEPEPVMSAMPPRPPHLSAPPPYNMAYDRVGVPVALPPSPSHERPLAPSPTSQQLQQAAARAVMVDQSIASSAHHNSHGARMSISSNLSDCYARGRSNGLPSPDKQSLSPQLPSRSTSPRHNRASLSNILHPTPSSSASSVVTNGTRSGSGSPRAVAAATHDLSTDARALRSLDRGFGRR